MLDSILSETTARAAEASTDDRAAPERTAQRVQRAIAMLDAALCAQVDAILHHPQFQRLEAVWRAVKLLIDRAIPDAERVLIRLFNARWEELARDAERALEFDQTVLFRKVYDDEFGMPGGIPYSVLIGDYEIHQRPSESHPTDDLAALARVAETSAAAFAPFIAGLHPAFLGLEDFAPLERHIDLERLFKSADYGSWHRFRKLEDARHVGLTLPRVLLRLPYADDVAVTLRRSCAKCGREFGHPTPAPCAGCGALLDRSAPATMKTQRLAFCYNEDVGGPDRSRYLWGNAAFAFAVVLLRAFSECAWFADIRGFERGQETGGVVAGLPVHEFGLDSPNVAPKMSTDVIVDDWMEKEIAEQGFIPLCHLGGTPYCAFYSNRSTYEPSTYTTIEATLNERLSAMLQYTLCVARFAHYIKVMARDWVGSAPEPAQLETRMRDWVNQYVTPDSMAPPDVRARYPLREAEVEIRAVPGRPGTYQCVMRLKPHYQLDDVFVSVRIRTTLRMRAAS